MKKLLLLFCLLPVGALAEDAKPLVVPMTLEEQVSWSQVRQAMDACTAAAVLRSDASTCRALADFLDTFAAKVKAAKPPAE